jgi:hypothetical protein
MATIPIFHGDVTADGRLELDGGERQRRGQYLRYLRGKRVEVEIRQARTKRSLDQNAYLHAVPFPILAAHFGDSIEGVKLDLMGECWGWHQSPVTGRWLPVKPHTSAMTVEECQFFIDWLIPWAMTEHGVEIPLPAEVAA